MRVSVKNGCLTVEDTGIGVDQQDQQKIFERFYRVDKSRSREAGGTGLGLSIVKHIAQLHGAQISLASELGKGTKISVRFPRSKPHGRALSGKRELYQRLEGAVKELLWFFRSPLTFYLQAFRLLRVRRQFRIAGVHDVRQVAHGLEQDARPCPRSGAGARPWTPSR